MRTAVILGICVIVLATAAMAFAQPVPAEQLQVTEQAAPQQPWSQALEAIFFYVISAAVLLSALGICISRNIVRMAVYLFFTLGGVAALYFLLLANFIAVIQLIVYAGGTLILLIFGVMLTSKSPWARFDVKKKEMIAAGIVCAVFAAVLLAVITTATWPVQSQPEVHAVSVANFGMELLTTYLVPFEAVSVLLLAVMIGAAYLARQE